MSLTEIDYTPSKWSKRYNEKQVLTHYYQVAKKVTDDARKNFKCELDVPYGDGERTKYDVYGTDLPKNAPIFVFIHGGYWQEGSKEVAAFAAPVLVKKGIKVITTGYDLCPSVRLTTIMSQIKAAIEHILMAAFNNGCRKVWISGHSAGAHLAVSILYDKLWLDRMTKQGLLNLLKGVVLIGGIFNLKPMVDTSFNSALQLTQDEVKAYSFTTLDTQNYIPVKGLNVIVIDAECNAPGLIKESRECAQQLVTFVDNVQYIFLREMIDHFDIVEKLIDEEYLLTKLILNNILQE